MPAREFPSTCPGSCRRPPSTHQSSQTQCHTKSPAGRDSCQYSYTITRPPASPTVVANPTTRVAVFLFSLLHYSLYLDLLDSSGMSVIDEVLAANEIYSRTHELRRLS